MLRAHTGIIQSGGNGVYRGNLAVLVLTEIGLHAVENAHPAGVNRGGGFKGVDAPSGGLTADQPDARVVDKVVEAADGVGTAAHAGHHRIGKTALFFQHLLFNFPGNHRLEIPDNGGEGMRSHDGAKAVVGVVNAGSPFPHGFGNRVL